jgi:O-antigen/teichoic acid export membrane protein
MNEKKWGGILSFVAIFIKIAVTFVYIPFVLSSIGKADYGLFAVVGSLIAYISIVDFGINDSTLRFFVKYRSSSDDKEKNDILGSVSTIYSCLGAIAIVVCLVIYSLLDILFESTFSLEQLGIIHLMFAISSVSIVTTLFFNPTGALLSAYERFVFLKISDIIVFLGTTITVVVFLYWDFGVVTMVFISAVFNVTNLLIRLYYVRNILKIPFPFLKPNKKLVKQIATYAGPIFIVVVIEQIYWKLDNILIGSLLGPVFVTIYAMGVVFQKYILSFATAISRIMTPDLIRKIDAKQSMETLTHNYIGTSRIQLIIVLLITLNLVFWGKPFITIWLGEDYRDSYYVLILILIPFSIEIIGNLRNTFLQVYGFYWHRAIIILIISIINIGFTVFLLKMYGVIGAALSTSVSLIAGYVVTNSLLRIKVGLNLFLFYKSVWLKILPVILIVASLWFGLSKFMVVNSWTSLIIVSLITSLTYIIIVWFYYLNDAEKYAVTKNFIKKREGL